MADDPLQLLRQTYQSMLPDAVLRTAASYEEFARRDAGSEPKLFAAHHGACKAALAHLEALGKLVKWLQKHPGTSDAQRNDELEDLLRRARDTLTRQLHDTPEDEYAEL